MRHEKTRVDIEVVSDSPSARAGISAIKRQAVRTSASEQTGTLRERLLSSALDGLHGRALSTP